MDMQHFRDTFTGILVGPLTIDIGRNWRTPGYVPVFSGEDKFNVRRNAQGTLCDLLLLLLTAAAGYSLYRNIKDPPRGSKIHTSRMETYNMFLNDDYGSVTYSPPPSISSRSNRYGAYEIQFLRIYPHFVHVVRV